LLPSLRLDGIFRMVVVHRHSPSFNLLATKSEVPEVNRKKQVR
jgi:hypothetical protein